MNLEFADNALGALVMSRPAFEAVYGPHYDSVLMCWQLLTRAHRFSDLMSFACLQVMTVVLVAGGTTITVAHRGRGLVLLPLDTAGRVVADWTNLTDLDAKAAAVTSLFGIPVAAAA